jgi:hypothetical protein
MTPLERVLANAAIVAGITFFSTLSIDYPPHAENIYAAGIAAVLILLTTIKSAFPDETLEDPDCKKRPPGLGMLI